MSEGSNITCQHLIDLNKKIHILTSFLFVFVYYLLYINTIFYHIIIQKIAIFMQLF